MKKILLKFGLFLTLYVSYIPNAFALDGLSLGGRVGYAGLGGGLEGSYDHGLGFGLDLGFAVNSVVDVLFQSQMSSHARSGDLKIFSETLGANMHFFQLNDFDFTAQFGPGFYFYKNALTTDTKFGLNFGVGADVIASDHLRIGLDWRYNFIFGSGPSLDYWTTMLRVTYLFFEI